MGPGRFLHPLSLSIGLVLACFAIAACSNDGTGDGGQSYAEVLGEFQQAASSGTAFDAIEQAGDLKVSERHVIDAFCEFAEQVVLGREAWKLDRHLFVVARIRRNAYDRGDALASEIRAAMGGLDETVDLRALTREKLKRYKEACHS